jgi:hypothetical protein
VPQHARGLGDLPLAVVGHKADLGMFAPTVVGRADLPPEVHRAHLPLLLLVLSLQRDVRRQAPQVRGLGSLDQLGQFGRLGQLGRLRVIVDVDVDVALLHTPDVVLPVGGGASGAGAILFIT